jgi:hypothetical protein
MDMLRIKQKLQEEPSSQSILVYGDSGIGKTRFAATAAQIPHIRKIVWLDLENGKDTILSMGLSDTELAKIQLIQLLDTRKDPHVMSTILKMFSSPMDIHLCEEHGRINCLKCSKEKLPTQVFNLTTLDSRDILVIDTGSQLTDCGVNALLKGQPEEAILPIQDWGTVVNWMKAICQVIQNARYCNTIMLCHMLPVETYSGTGINRVLQKTDYFPMAGTQAFSRKFGAYFSTEIFLELRGNKHSGGSSTTYKKGVQTKSRSGIRVEDLPELHMKYLFPFKDKEIAKK